MVRFARRFVPMTHRYDGQKFWTVENGRRVATPLFLVLLLVEVSDLVFAILGLRSMYFLLAGVMHNFVYLNYGLSGVLVFVGAKMMLIDVYKIPTAVSLGVIAALIGGSIAVSCWAAGREGNGGPQKAAAPAPVSS